MTVTVDYDALVRAWQRASDGEFMWEFLPAVEGDIVDEVGAAVVATNDRASAQAGSGAFSESPSESDRGAACLMLGPEESGELIDWFDTFAAELSTRRLAGAIAPAREAKFPRWARDLNLTGRALTACIGFPLDPEVAAGLKRDGISRLPLGIAPDLAHQVSQSAAEWSQFDESEIALIRRGLFLSRTTVEGAAADLASAAARSASASVSWLTRRPGRLRVATFGAMGGFLAQWVDLQTPWESQLDSIVGLMRSQSSRADFAYVKRAAPLTPSWDADLNPPTPAAHAEAHIARGPRLRSFLVPDAHGVQILSANHLGRAHDLSTWSVEDLGEGRYLVSHPRPEMWYARPEPDPDVLHQARADFGAMIATEDDLAGDVRNHML